MASPPLIPLDQLFPFEETTQPVMQSSTSQAQLCLTGFDECFPLVSETQPVEQSSIPQKRLRLTRKTIAAGQSLSAKAIRKWAHSVLQGEQGGQVPQFDALQCFKTLLPRRFGSTFEKLQAHIKKKMKTKYQMSWLHKCRGFLQGSRHQVWIFGRPFRGSDICADQRVDALRRLQVLHLLQLIAGGKRGDLDIGCLCSMIHWAATGRQFRVWGFS